MVQIVKIAVLVLAAVLSACSMQPMIDATLPTLPASGDGREAASEPPVIAPEIKPTPTPIPDQRAVVVSTEQPLPAAAQSLRVKAQQLQRQGDNTAAILQLERAVKIAPRSALMYFELAKAYRLQGDANKARVFAQKALSLGPSKRLGSDIRKLLGVLS